jgi:hypothetical protein
VKSNKVQWAVTVARTGERISTSAYRVFMEDPLGKLLHRRPRRRWEDNIKKSVREMDGAGSGPSTVVARLF